MATQVILDTDLGTDIDDSWALGMLLNQPQLELRLVLSATADTTYRARVAAKHLDQMGRTDIPIGVGLFVDDPRHKLTLADWVSDYPLERYPGAVHPDGLAQMIALVEQCDDPVILEIAPQTNLAAFCLRRPDLVPKCRVVSMAGSIRTGYNGKPGAAAEWNVRADIEAAKAVFAAPWKRFTITPLDHCGQLILEGEDYQAILRSERPVPRSIREAYQAWCVAYHKDDFPHRSSVLFDTAAVHLAVTEEDSLWEEHRLGVDDQGALFEDPVHGAPVHAALAWKDKAAYLHELVRVLLS